MKMRVVVPFRRKNAKSRLSNLLSEEERQNFALLMLIDVLNVLKPLDVSVTVLSPSELPELEEIGIDAKLDSRSLNECINSEIELLEGEGRIGDGFAVVMSDLPLLSRDTFERFIGTEGDVVIAPGRKGGTNMLLTRSRGFRVSYHYGSFFNHLKRAKEMNLRCSIFDSFYASVDIDDESDLLELMLHGKGKESCRYLEELGFYVEFGMVPELKRA